MFNRSYCVSSKVMYQFSEKMLRDRYQKLSTRAHFFAYAYVLCAEMDALAAAGARISNLVCISASGVCSINNYGHKSVPAHCLRREKFSIQESGISSTQRAE